MSKQRRTRRDASAGSGQLRDTDGWDALGLLSALILIIAFIVPTALGLGFLAIGLAGLFIFRIAAMHRP
jgi:hypothetical protein